MTLTATQKRELVDKLLTRYSAIDEELETVSRAFGGNTEAPLPDAIWRMFDAYADAVMALIGDTDGWLTWYIYDNEMGKGDLKRVHYMGGKRRKRNIRTVDQLMKVIG